MHHKSAPMLATGAVFLLLILWSLNAAAPQTEPRSPPADNNNNNAAAAQPAPDISYTVSAPQPSTHLLDVELRLRWGVQQPPPPAHIDLIMPVWTPGSYLVREYARHVQDFAVAAAAGGRALAWRKANKNTWRVETAAAREIVVTYRVYANELSVRTNEVNDRHAFWNNAAVLMYIDGHTAAPSTLRVIPSKENWKVATGLPLAAAGAPHTFRAENFDVLYDSPVLVGDYKTLQFEVRNVPHRIVIDGEGNYEAGQLRRDVQKIVETTVSLMGDVPYRDYTFMLMLHPTLRGGLEHLNSTALIWRRFGFRPAADYRDFLSLVAHEYFHLWNVKRIRPDALGPFDYTRENYTRLLWVAEGITSYYDNLIVRRAGLMTDKEYLNLMAKAFEDLQNTPGRLEMSLQEASFDAWIKYYRPDENSINSSVSYYDKGAIVGLLLDLEIRRRSKGDRSLDDVLRYLYSEYAKRGRNYAPEDFQRAAELAAGSGLGDFFRNYVNGTAELDYNAALAAAGLRLVGTGTTAAAPRRTGSEKAYLGATLVQDDERLLIRNVPAGTPAYAQGLNAGDQIVAINGLRATLDFLNARLEEKRPGDTVRLTVFRLDELRDFEIKLGGRASDSYRIVPIEAASTMQREIYREWLGSPYPRAAAAATQ